MPQASRQRRDALNREKWNVGKPPSQQYIRFVHYTSAEAALSIIRTKRVWMRNALAMVDYREVGHGLDLLKAIFNKEGVDKLKLALDVYSPGAATAGGDSFNETWQQINLDTYIASISKHNDDEDQHGRLSMWRAFGNSPGRVAIVLKIPCLYGRSRVSEPDVQPRFVFDRSASCASVR